jgi:hypothetical protein
MPYTTAVTEPSALTWSGFNRMRRVGSVIHLDERDVAFSQPRMAERPMPRGEWADSTGNGHPTTEPSQEAASMASRQWEAMRRKRSLCRAEKLAKQREHFDGEARGERLIASEQRGGEGSLPPVRVSPPPATTC